MPGTAMIKGAKPINAKTYGTKTFGKKGKIKRRAAGRGAESWSQKNHTVHVVGGPKVKGYSRGTITQKGSGPVNVGGKIKNVNVSRSSTIHTISGRKAGAAVAGTAVVGGAAAYKYSKSDTHKKRKAAKAAVPASAKHQKTINRASAVATVGTGVALLSGNPKHQLAGAGALVGGSAVVGHYAKKHDAAVKSERKAKRLAKANGVGANRAVKHAHAQKAFATSASSHTMGGRR